MTTRQAIAIAVLMALALFGAIGYARSQDPCAQTRTTNLQLALEDHSLAACGGNLESQSIQFLAPDDRGQWYISTFSEVQTAAGGSARSIRLNVGAKGLTASLPAPQPRRATDVDGLPPEIASYYPGANTWPLVSPSPLTLRNTDTPPYSLRPITVVAAAGHTLQEYIYRHIVAYLPDGQPGYVYKGYISNSGGKLYIYRGLYYTDYPDPKSVVLRRQNGVLNMCAFPGSTIPPDNGVLMNNPAYLEVTPGVSC
ncbi:MAG TPA: hypothetical protein VLI05_00760 [Candidatus Saccharimonadia bacterium]|nr:hypothetical protein [Candidatus Saccharimonadia bacterium]